MINCFEVLIFKFNLRPYKPDTFTSNASAPEYPLLSSLTAQVSNFVQALNMSPLASQLSPDAADRRGWQLLHATSSESV